MTSSSTNNIRASEENALKDFVSWFTLLTGEDNELIIFTLGISVADTIVFVFSV